jgi:nucleoside-triphosphatase
VRGLVTRLTEYRPAGFYTEELRDAQGHREGFRLITLCGRQLVLAHIRQPGPYRVGRYGVDVSGFERMLAQLELGRSPSPLIMIDEIGKMECLSPRFRGDMMLLLNQQKVLIATVARKGDGFVKLVKDRPDCRLVMVTRENRDRLMRYHDLI